MYVARDGDGGKTRCGRDVAYRVAMTLIGLGGGALGLETIGGLLSRREKQCNCSGKMKTAVLVVVTVALCGINLPQLGREMWFGQLRAKWEVSTVIVPLEPIRNQPATSLGIGNLVGRYRWGLQWRYGTVRYGTVWNTDTWYGSASASVFCISFRKVQNTSQPDVPHSENSRTQCPTNYGLELGVE